MLWRIWNWIRNLFVAEVDACQCGHYRCYHEKGKLQCQEQTPDGTCRCQKFIRPRDGGWGGHPDGLPTPTPRDLERMVR